ncbi:MAG: hypothetical protein Q8N96_00705 [Methylovulum sp.]|nr:hypothetical protein [Methylovulum sp.]
MKKNKRYSEAYQEQALAKVYRRGKEQTIQPVADGLTINHYTLKNWMKTIPLDDQPAETLKPKRPQDWRAEGRLAALQKTYGLIGEDLQRFHASLRLATQVGTG